MKRSLFLALAICTAAASFSNAESFFSTEGLRYTISAGAGTTVPIDPEAFTRDYNPSFGLMLDGGVGKDIIEITGTFDYSFFLAKSSIPNDVNVLNVFLTAKIKPLDTTARPYILVTGGYYRYWIYDPPGPWENVLGYGGGFGVEMEVDKKRRVFLEGRYIAGQTRETARKVNTYTVPVRFGLTWIFQ